MKPTIFRSIKDRNDYLRYRILESFRPTLCPTLDLPDVYLKFPIMLELMRKIDDYKPT